MTEDDDTLGEALKEIAGDEAPDSIYQMRDSYRITFQHSGESCELTLYREAMVTVVYRALKAHEEVNDIRVYRRTEEEVEWDAEGT